MNQKSKLKPLLLVLIEFSWVKLTGNYDMIRFERYTNAYKFLNTKQPQINQDYLDATTLDRYWPFLSSNLLAQRLTLEAWSWICTIILKSFTNSRRADLIFCIKAFCQCFVNKILVVIRWHFKFFPLMIQPLTKLNHLFLMMMERNTLFVTLFLTFVSSYVNGHWVSSIYKITIKDRILINARWTINDVNISKLKPKYCITQQWSNLIFEGPPLPKTRTFC